MELVDALEFDLTRADSSIDDGEVQEATMVDFSDESSTESVVQRRQRRLHLVWRGEDEVVWHRDVRAAEGVVQNLAARIGFVPAGGHVPAVVRRQRWSPLNVPLMWAAAGQEESSPVLDWLCRVSHGGRVGFQEGIINAQEAVRDGWTAMRSVFRMWSIHEREDLTMWLRNQGFPGTHPGNHISARAQEHILTEACRTDARVALLEASYVEVVLLTGRQMAVPEATTAPNERHRPGNVSVESGYSRAWESLDTINCKELFLTKIPMLKSCPRFLRGRLRECFSFALRERQRGKIVGDEQAELRGWKLFAVIPIMLLHKTQGIGSVGRDELAQRVEDFTRGRWIQLIAQAKQHPHQVRQARLGTDSSKLG